MSGWRGTYALSPFSDAQEELFDLTRAIPAACQEQIER